MTYVRGLLTNTACVLALGAGCRADRLKQSSTYVLVNRRLQVASSGVLPKRTEVCVQNLNSVNVDTSLSALTKHNPSMCVLLNTRSVRNKTTLLCEHVLEFDADLSFLT